jgi:bacteriorhodopsin
MFSNSPIYHAIRKGLAGSAYLVVTVAAVTAIAAVILTTMPATTKPHPHNYATTAVLP